MSKNFGLIFKALKKICATTSKNVSLATLSSFKIGGTAKVVVEPSSVEEIIRVFDYLNTHKIKHFVVGNCTNLLFDDSVYAGVIVKISSKFGCVEFRGTTVVADAGVSLSGLAVLACQRGLGGLEDAFGIPGTLGGAVTMNAGAFGFKMEQLVTSVLAIVNGKITLLSGAECKFGYRQSVFKGSDAIILRVELKLKKSRKVDLENRRAETNAKRLLSQPIGQASAGSIFKNPDGISVAKLIEEQGLKGFAIGGAMVSTKHSNFIVNTGHASSQDVLRLVEHIKNVILKKYNITLETEIIHVT